MGELKDEVGRYFDQQAKISSYAGRVLIMHTRYDDLVSVSHAERLHDWANEPKELVLFERGDHNTILPANVDAYFAKVGNLVNQVSAELHQKGYKHGVQ
jgi:hypothetical protein